MSIGDVVYLGLCVAAFVLVFAISDDEPFVVRVSVALAVALLWLPTLILFALMLLVDGVAALIVRVRK